MGIDLHGRFQTRKHALGSRHRANVAEPSPFNPAHPAAIAKGLNCRVRQLILRGLPSGADAGDARAGPRADMRFSLTSRIHPIRNCPSCYRWVIDGSSVVFGHGRRKLPVLWGLSGLACFSLAAPLARCVPIVGKTPI